MRRFLFCVLVTVSGGWFFSNRAGAVEKETKESSDLSFIDQERRRSRLDVRDHSGLVISNDDGSYSMNLRARIQTRFTQGIDDDRKDLQQSEFVVRRMRLSLRGNVHNPNWQYYIQFGFANQDEESDLSSSLRDAVITYARFPNMNVNVGQMKIPFSRQRVNSSGNLQMPDRSRVSSELNLDRDVGVTLTSIDLLRLNYFLGYAMGVFGGDGRNRRSKVPGVLTMGKIFISPFGRQDYLSEVDFEGYTTPKLTIGLAVAQNNNTNRKLSTMGDTYEFSRFDYRHLSVDFMTKWRGTTLTGEYLCRDSNKDYRISADDPTLREYSRSACGYFLQGGYLFPFMTEIALRFGELNPMAGTDPKMSYSKEIGAGISHYFDEHELKIQFDYHQIYGNFANDRVGFSHEIRVQLQMMI